MLVTIGTTDITKHILESSYIMNATPNEKTWVDGNDVTHGIVTSEKINGSFTVALYGKDGMDARTFLNLIKEVTEDNVTTMLVYVSNKAENVVIEAGLKITNSSHKKLEKGTYLDVFELEVKER